MLEYLQESWKRYKIRFRAGIFCGILILQRLIDPAFHVDGVLVRHGIGES